MTHKTFINICLTLIALCWTMAIQAQTVTVDGINYYLNSDKTAEVTKSNVTGDIVIPEKITVDGVDYSVTSIGYEAFKNCSALTSIKMPSVTSIDYGAFRECPILTAVDMPSVTRIEAYAFSYCQNLKMVDMPLVARIEQAAFESCSSLISVNMPLITSIDNSVFPNCSSLTSVDMPSVTSIAGSAFSQCSSLTSVDMPSVTSIASNAFSECSSLTSVSMPSVTSIGNTAFADCPIINLSLPATLTSIGNSCFTATKEITLAATTPAALGTDAFWKYAVIRVPESAVDAYRTAAGWSNYKDKILSMSDKTDYDVTVTAQEKESGLQNMITQEKLDKVVSLKVTGTINGYDIMVIRNKMPILHYLDLTDATIVANDYEYYTGYHTEDNIIGNYMFASLGKLLSVKLPKNAISIRGNALLSCSSLVEVVLPIKLEEIGGSVFSDCAKLASIDFPPSLKKIGSLAFKGCI